MRNSPLIYADFVTQMNADRKSKERRAKGEEEESSKLYALCSRKSALKSASICGLFFNCGFISGTLSEIEVVQ